MGHNARWEYFRAIYGRYQKAGRKARHAMLNEFCMNTGYHRKYAIRLLNRANPAHERTQGRVGEYERRRYGPNAVDSDRGVGSGGIPLVGAAEGDAADVDAVDSQALQDRPREGAGATGDQPPADGPSTARQEAASASKTLRTH